MNENKAKRMRSCVADAYAEIRVSLRTRRAVSAETFRYIPLNCMCPTRGRGNDDLVLHHGIPSRPCTAFSTGRMIDDVLGIM